MPSVRSISVSLLSLILSTLLFGSSATAQSRNLYNPDYRGPGTNNMDIYNRTLQRNRPPSQRKRFDDAQLEAPMLDVDAIVRREEAARRRQQQQRQQQLRQGQPEQQGWGCREGTRVSNTGCGPMGIQACTCVQGQPTWVPHGHVSPKYRR